MTQTTENWTQTSRGSSQAFRRGLRHGKLRGPARPSRQPSSLRCSKMEAAERSRGPGRGAVPGAPAGSAPSGGCRVREAPARRPRPALWQRKGRNGAVPGAAASRPSGRADTARRVAALPAHKGGRWRPLPRTQRDGGPVAAPGGAARAARREMRSATPVHGGRAGPPQEPQRQGPARGLPGPVVL